MPKRKLTPWNPVAGQNRMSWDEWKMRHAGAGGATMRKKFEESTSEEGGRRFMEEWGASAADPMGRLDDKIKTGEVKLRGEEGERVRKGNLTGLLTGIPPDSPPLPKSAKQEQEDAIRSLAQSRVLYGPKGPRAVSDSRFKGTRGKESYKENLKRTGQSSSALAAGRFLSGQGKQVTSKMAAAMKAAANQPRRKRERQTRASR